MLSIAESSKTRQGVFADRVISAMLFAVPFALYYGIMRSLAAHDILNQWNVFFDADPPFWTSELSSG